MQIASQPARHAEQSAKIASFVDGRAIATVAAAIGDPFGTGPRCEFSPDGRHHDVVCCHCSRIFWS